MRIPSALESMVADLISDETRRREEVEGVLSKIHELTEEYFNPEKAAGREAAEALLSVPEEPPAPVLSQAEKLKNFKGMFERKGLPEAVAQEKAEEVLGLRDGSR